MLVYLSPSVVPIKGSGGSAVIPWENLRRLQGGIERSLAGPTQAAIFFWQGSARVQGFAGTVGELAPKAGKLGKQSSW
jgi:hypothetical protein